MNDDRVYMFENPTISATDYNFTRAGSRGSQITNFDDHLSTLIDMEDGNKLLTKRGIQTFKSSGGLRGHWIQRGFKFAHQYQTLLDRALEDFGIDPSSKLLVQNQEVDFDDFKKSGIGPLVQTEPNRLWDWDETQA